VKEACPEVKEACQELAVKEAVKATMACRNVQKLAKRWAHPLAPL